MVGYFPLLTASVGLGFELRVSALTKQAFYCLSHTSSTVAFFIIAKNWKKFKCPSRGIE
jgi:hypothetical protein